MLRRGCEGLTAEEIDFRIDSLGAEVEVDTSPSTVAIHAQVLSRNAGALVELLSRLLSSPTFVPDQLERLRRETIASIVEARDNDRVVAQKALQRTLFEDHPYGRNPGGTTESVAAITRDDVIDFYKRHVVQSNIVIGISGDMSPDEAPLVARRLVASLPVGSRMPDDVVEPTLRTGRRLLVVDKPERTQTQILVGTLGTSASDEDHIDLQVANAVFGGTFTSRLMREIRSKRGWTYGASARISVDRRRQAWVMGTFPAAENAAPCLTLMLELMEEWVKNGVTQREVTFIERYLVRSHAFDVDTAAKRLHQALDVELLALPDDYYTRWTERVLAVTPESASAAVARRIHPRDTLAVVLGTATQVLAPLRDAMPDLTEATVVPFDAE
jgi:zinc protease